MFAALAVIVAFSVCGQQAYAEGIQLHVAAAGNSLPAGAVTPDVSSKVYQLSAGVSDSIPPGSSSSNPIWPCFTGGSDPNCSSLPAGAVVEPYPMYTLSLADAAAGDVIWLYWWFEDDNASKTKQLEGSITITQGASTILQTGTLDFGDNIQGSVIVSGTAVVGVGQCATATCVEPVSGKATMTVETWVGTGAHVTGKAIFQFK
jgi:hypothetical protein